MKLTTYFVLLLLVICTNALGQQSAFPVTLSNPMDYDTIIETEPNLIWQTNLSALQTDPRYSQRLVLCELEENQLKGDAIAINTPILVLEDYQNTMHSYSSSSTPLEEGHTYVWQVSILFNSMIVDQSEVFQFTILEPKDPLPKFYPVVFKNDGQTYAVVNDQVGLVSDETGDLKLTIQVFKGGRPIKTALLKEYIAGQEPTSEAVSKSGSSKRFFILKIQELELDPGYYNVIWAPKSNRSFTFNFRVE